MKALEDIIDLDKIPPMLAKINFRAPNGCWEWMGSKTDLGYGRVRTRRAGPNESPHRIMYEMQKDEIPAGYVIDHLCRNPSCVNPKHLEPVTQRENLMRGQETRAGINAAKTQCPKCGGEFRLFSDGHRRCDPCRRAYNIAYDKKRHQR